VSNQPYKPAIAAAVAEWANRSRFYVVALIRDDYLTGKALKRRTGTAARSVTGELLATAKGFKVGTTLIYLIAWEFGIRAHKIVPKSKKALAFKIGAQQIVVRSVQIPAQAARPSFEPALRDSIPYMHQTAVTLLTAAVNSSFPNRTIRVL